MIAPASLHRLAKEHGTPLFVVDHAVLRKNYAAFQAAAAPRAGLLRGEGQSRPGDRQDALRGGGQLRRGLHARVPHRLREHPVAARQGAAGLHLGQDHLRQSHQGQRDAARSWTPTSRW